MREPEFIPDWYRLRVRRRRGLRALANTAVALSALAAGWLTLSPGRAPAVGPPDVSVSSPDDASPRRSRVPSGAGRALRTLQRLTPEGVAVSTVTFRDGDGATGVELHCAADSTSAADQFVTSLHGSRAFHNVIVSRASAAGGRPDVLKPLTLPDPSPIALRVTFKVTAAAEAL